MMYYCTECGHEMSDKETLSDLGGYPRCNECMGWLAPLEKEDVPSQDEEDEC